MIRSPDKIQKNIKPKYDDDFIDRINYFYTSYLFLIIIVIIGMKQYVGQPLQCWLAAEYKPRWEKYIESHCSNKNTYYLSFDNERFPAVEKRKDLEIHYYQWVPIFLFFQLLCSFVPKKICTKFSSMSSLNFRDIIKNFGDGKERYKKFMTTPEANDKEVREATKYFLSAMKFQKIRIDSFMGIFSTKFHCNYLTMVYLFYKLSNFINSFAQLYFMNQFFNTSYKFWGFGVLKDIYSMRDWKSSGNFPRVTFCDFERRDDTNGKQMIYPVQCVLMINMVIEKLYIILWFWFLILTIANFANFVSWLLLSFNPKFSKEFVINQLKYSNCNDFDEEDIPKFIKDQIIKDGITVLRLVSANSGNMISSDCIAVLYEEWKKEQQEKQKFTFNIKKINAPLEAEMFKKNLLQEILFDSKKDE